jgi:hypothetical protein
MYRTDILISLSTVIVVLDIDYYNYVCIQSLEPCSSVDQIGLLSELAEVWCSAVRVSTFYYLLFDVSCFPSLTLSIFLQLITQTSIFF